MEHRKAITMLSEIKDMKKQGKLMKPVIEKIFEILANSADYNSSKDFASLSLKERGELSIVLENLLFLSDFVLRLPDTTRGILKKIAGSLSRIQTLLSSYGKTSVLESTDLLALNLMAQELNLVERQEDYVNIYTEKYRIQVRWA
ncbi:hypothetical protein RvY_15691 [Ramazzottius varieornatus]|uniref:Uncharacterized protein n=1 Tax=Ramazzottius varieornatus TaxID=947166 RepID=A0A1D1VVU4_RAMVA|nr:hypothetical protein RvY_15691 [Ramazzottius varieornatus]